MTEKARVTDAVQQLSDGEIERVSQFIESLRKNRSCPPVGSVEAVRRAVGSWWMSPDETAHFLDELERMRHVKDADRAVPPQY